jgi:MoxR-like ATPase
MGILMVLMGILMVLMGILMVLMGILMINDFKGIWKTTIVE